MSISEFFDKVWIVLGVIFIIGLIIWGIACLAAPKTKILEPFDPSVSSENTATFVFHKNFNVKNINESPISWNAGLSRSASIELPAGAYTFLVNFNDSNWSASNIKVTGNFAKGKIYILTYYLDTKEKVIKHLIKEIDNETYVKLKKSMSQGKYFKNKELK